MFIIRQAPDEFLLRPLRLQRISILPQIWNGRKKLPRKSELRGSLEWIYGFSRSSVWLSKMWNFPFSMFSEIVLPMTVLPPAIFATSI